MKPLDLDRFATQFELFKTLIAYNSQDRPFVSFQEGLPAVWESYKPRLRDHALAVLDPGSWSLAEIGSGAILERLIDAIEIDERRRNLMNNLVFWQNRYGHANRAHRALLEARTDKRLRTEVERQIFGLFRDEADEAATFDHLAELTYSKYPLLAYIFFLKDIDRFMPIHPSAFDRAFRELHIDLVTLRRCSWDNYSLYNQALSNIRDTLRQVAGVSDARLVDAHSFCWMLVWLERPAPGAENKPRPSGREAGYIYGPREKSIWEMAEVVRQTTKHARGQMEHRRVKLKELQVSDMQLEEMIGELLTQQEDRCALTGLPLQFRGAHTDHNLLASLDRIDSSGHYEKGNLQVVCRFVNFWKRDSDNEEFKRLLMLVRGLEE